MSNDRIAVEPVLLAGEQVADRAQTLQIVDVLGQRRYLRGRHQWMRGGEAHSEALLGGAGAHPIGMQREQGGGLR